MKYEIQKIGTDAEVFLRTRTTGTPKTAIGLIGGNKMYPLQIRGMKLGCMVQEDNVMPEFNIPPAVTAKEFSASIDEVMKYLKNLVKKHGLVIDVKSSMHFNMDDLHHPQAQTFGCEPDYCAWVDVVKSVHEAMNQRDSCNPILNTLRTAAAHIHVSYKIDGKAPTTFHQRSLAVRAQDLFIGVPSIFLDKDRERRILYGKAGSFREKDYGHEYRTVGNFWIKSDKERKWVFNQTYQAFSFLEDDRNVKILLEDEYIKGLIKDSINNYDENAASFLCNYFSIEVPA